MNLAKKYERKAYEAVDKDKGIYSFFTLFFSTLVTLLQCDCAFLGTEGSNALIFNCFRTFIVRVLWKNKVKLFKL